MNVRRPRVEILGLYRIRPTRESLSAAAKYQYLVYPDRLLDDQGNWTLDVPWSEFRDLGLVEMRLAASEGSFEDMEICQFHDDPRSGENQAPYLEFFLDENEEVPLVRKEVLRATMYRVCFFLHFADDRKPLFVNNTEFALPRFSELPARLAPFTHYLPVGSA